jgi:hypothetical protein
MEALAFQQEYSFIASSVYDYSVYGGGSKKINLNGHSFTVQYNGAKLFVDGLPGGPIKLEPGKDVILAFKGSTVAVLFSNSLKETAQKLQSLESNGWEVYRMYTDGIYRSERGSYAGFHIERITADFSKWTEKSIIRATYQETLTFRLEDGKDLSIITVYNNGKPYYFMNGEITNGKVEPYFDIGAKIKTRDGRIIPLHQALREISLNPNLIQDYAYKRQVFHPGSNDHMKTQKFWDPNRTNVIFHKPSQNSSTDVRANLHEPVRQDSKDVPASLIPNQLEEQSNSQNLKDVPTKHEPVRQDSKDVPANLHEPVRHNPVKQDSKDVPASLIPNQLEEQSNSQNLKDVPTKHEPVRQDSKDVPANLHEPVRHNPVKQDSKDVPASLIPNQLEEQSNSQNLKDVPTKHEPVRQDSKDVPANLHEPVRHNPVKQDSKDVPASLIPNQLEEQSNSQNLKDVPTKHEPVKQDSKDVPASLIPNPLQDVPANLHEPVRHNPVKQDSKDVPASLIPNQLEEQSNSQNLKDVPTKHEPVKQDSKDVPASLIPNPLQDVPANLHEPVRHNPVKQDSKDVPASLIPNQLEEQSNSQNLKDVPTKHEPVKQDSKDVPANLHEPVRHNPVKQDSKDVPASLIPNQLEEQSNSQNLKDVPTKHEPVKQDSKDVPASLIPNPLQDVPANLHEPVRHNPVKQDSKDVPANNITGGILNQTQQSETSPNQESKVNEQDSNTKELVNANKTTQSSQSKSSSSDIRRFLPSDELDQINDSYKKSDNQTTQSSQSKSSSSDIRRFLPSDELDQINDSYKKSDNQTTQSSQSKSSSSDIRRFLPSDELDQINDSYKKSDNQTTQSSQSKSSSSDIRRFLPSDELDQINDSYKKSDNQTTQSSQSKSSSSDIRRFLPSDELDQINDSYKKSDNQTTQSSQSTSTQSESLTERMSVKKEEKLEQSVKAEQQKQPETLKRNNFSFGVQSNLLNGNMSNNLTNSNGSSFGVRNSLLNQNLTGSMDQTQQSETSSDVDQSNQNFSNSSASSTLNQGITANGLSVERSAVLEQTFTLNLGELNGVNVALTVERYSDGSYMIQYGDSSVKIDGNREVIVYVQDGKLKLQEANPQLKSELSRKGITFYTIKKATEQEPVQDWASKSVYTLTTENGQQIKVVHYITQSGESRYFIEKQGKLIEYNPTTDQERIMVIDSTGKLVELSKAVPERFISVKRINDDLYVEFDSNTKRNYDALSELKLNDYEKSLLGSILPHLSPDEIRSAITELETQGQELSFYHLYKILYQKAIESNAKERSYRSPAI